MKNINYKIFYSILAGVLILLGIYLLFDLHVIGIDTDQEEDVENNTIIIEDPEPIQTIDENITTTPVIETNTTEVVNETKTVEPEKQQTQTQTQTQTQKTEPVKNETKTEEAPKPKVYFDQKEFNCYAGDDFATEVRTDVIYGAEVPTIKSLNSGNTSILTVEKHPTLTSNCVGCTMIRVNCKSDGKTTIKATSSVNQSATAQVVVKKRPAGTITFDKENYSCDEGQTITAMLNVRGGYYDDIKSYVSADRNIASLSPSATQDNCVGCLKLDIKCYKAGNVTITATSKNGATVTSNVEVIRNVGSINFDKSSYTCKEGDTIKATITPIAKNGTNEAPKVSSFSSSDTNLVKIAKNTDASAPCTGCEPVIITCKKEGSVELSAKNNFGATIKVPVTVNKVDSSISFSPDLVSCDEGKTKTIIMTYNPAVLESFKIENGSIAMATKSLIQPGEANRMSFDIRCINPGHTTLNVKLINGYEKNLTIVVN